MESTTTLLSWACLLLLAFTSADKGRHQKQYDIYSIQHHLDTPGSDVSVESINHHRNKRDEPQNETDYIVEEVNHLYYTAKYYQPGSGGMDLFWIDMENEDDDDVVIQNTLSTNHRMAVLVPLSFDFPFYGHIMRQAVVTTGGFIYAGSYIHRWLASTQYISPLMANFDLSLYSNSSVKVRDNGTMFTAEWHSAFLQDDQEAGSYTFQVSIYQDGKITFAYKNIPKPVSEISDSSHPVKVGLADAYYHDRRLGGGKIMRSIYEYHRFSLEYRKVLSGSVVLLEPLPTCHLFDSCDACTDSSTGFNCSWCETTGKCSSGFDRHRQEWVENDCDENGVMWHHACPATSTQASTTATPSTTVSTTTVPAPTITTSTPTAATTTTTVDTTAELKSNHPATTSTTIPLTKFTAKAAETTTAELLATGPDPCLSNPCYRGSCTVNHHGNFECDCNAGFTGIRCEKSVDRCASDPCQNDGKCVNGANKYFCDCQPGYEGDYCQKIIDMDFCAELLPCLNGGTCVNKIGGYRCICTLSWYGRTCQKRDTSNETPKGDGQNVPSAKQVQDSGRTKSVGGGGVNIGGLVSFFIIVVLFAVVIGWVVYAYKFPNTKSGIFLIEIRRGNCLKKEDVEDRYQVNLHKVEGDGEADA